MKSTAVLYTRVSSKEQEEQGFSLAAQRDLLESYARQNHMTIVARFEESETAKAGGKRPAFANMVEYLKSRSSRPVLLVEKTDRLYRNVKDWITLDELQVEIHFVKEGSVISPESHSSQKFLHGIKVLMAKNYVENLSEEIRKGMTRKAKEGAFPSVAPIGYRNVADKSVGIEPDPEIGPLVTGIFERAASGNFSVRELTRLAKQAGVRSRRGHGLAGYTLFKLLRNPVYTGRFLWGGKVYEGKYQPLVTRELFAKAQLALNGGKRAKGRKRTFAFSGLATCGTCGGMLSGDLKKGRFIYYVCNGPKTCRRFYPERLLERKTLDLLGSLQIDQAVSEALLSEIEKAAEDGFDERRVRALTARRKELQSLRSRAYEEKLMGKIDEAFWNERSSAWQTELSEIDSALSAAANSVSKADLVAAARKPIELAQVACDLYVTQEPQEKARLLKTLVSNYTVTDGKLSVSMRSPFDVLLRGAESQDWWS